MAADFKIRIINHSLAYRLKQCNGSLALQRHVPALQPEKTNSPLISIPAISGFATAMFSGIAAILLPAENRLKLLYNYYPTHLEHTLLVTPAAEYIYLEPGNSWRLSLR